MSYLYKVNLSVDGTHELISSIDINVEMETEILAPNEYDLVVLFARHEFYKLTGKSVPMSSIVCNHVIDISGDEYKKLKKGKKVRFVCKDGEDVRWKESRGRKKKEESACLTQ